MKVGDGTQQKVCVCLPRWQGFDRRDLVGGVKKDTVQNQQATGTLDPGRRTRRPWLQSPVRWRAQGPGAWLGCVPAHLVPGAGSSMMWHLQDLSIRKGEAFT